MPKVEIKLVNFQLNLGTIDILMLTHSVISML